MTVESAADEQASPDAPKNLVNAAKIASRNLVGDLFAGAVIAASNIALAVSFAAAIFQGELAQGFTTGVWIMLMSMIVVGLIVGFLTTLQPIAAGPDAAVIAVVGLMAPAVAVPLLAAGNPKADALVHVMLGITLVAIASGLTLLLIGLLRLGQSLRFVPYPLIAGFLAATGILLITFSLKIVVGGLSGISEFSTLWSGDNSFKLAVMLAFAVLLGAARIAIRSPLVTPLAFFGFAAALHTALQAGHFGDYEGWYVSEMRGLEPWLPLDALRETQIDWSVYVWALPELATCVIVVLISLIVRISTFESSRMAAADINHELRIYGAASLVSGLSGGMTGGILFSTSKFLADSSAQTRFAYIVIAAFLALIIFANVDLSRFVPTPILGGFLLLLGYAMTAEALKVTLQQRAILEVFLAIGIMFLCLWFGFISGVFAGFVAACLLFAFNCARVGVIRRHSTRSFLAGATERAHDVEAQIRSNGKSIHVFELQGYIFFGSSEALFEKIQQRRRNQASVPIRHIIIDFSRVTGYDSSAINTLNKLRGYCRKHDIQLALSGLSDSDSRKILPPEKTKAASHVQFFGSLNQALDWAEESLLSSLGLEWRSPANGEDFRCWLSAEIGMVIPLELVDRFFDHIEVPAGEQLYAQGDAANTIDFIVAGTVAMMLETTSGQRYCVRHSSRQTVLGEMGFFRRAKRNVSVVAERPTTVYSLSRTNFDAIKEANSEFHDGLLNFVIRILADRLEMATIELSAMRHVNSGEMLEQLARDNVQK
jgi:SulP family sulfate permease